VGGMGGRHRCNGCRRRSPWARSPVGRLARYPTARPGRARGEVGRPARPSPRAAPAAAHSAAPPARQPSARTPARRTTPGGSVAAPAAAWRWAADRRTGPYPPSPTTPRSPLQARGLPAQLPATVAPEPGPRTAPRPRTANTAQPRAASEPTRGPAPDRAPGSRPGGVLGRRHPRLQRLRSQDLAQSRAIGCGQVRQDAQPGSFRRVVQRVTAPHQTGQFLVGITSTRARHLSASATKEAAGPRRALGEPPGRRAARPVPTGQAGFGGGRAAGRRAPRPQQAADAR
jgi:hypothetical protein